jgi:hypothetical protein
MYSLKKDHTFFRFTINVSIEFNSSLGQANYFVSLPGFASTGTVLHFILPFHKRRKPPTQTRHLCFQKVLLYQFFSLPAHAGAGAGLNYDLAIARSMPPTKATKLWPIINLASQCYYGLRPQLGPAYSYAPRLYHSYAQGHN